MRKIEKASEEVGAWSGINGWKRSYWPDGLEKPKARENWSFDSKSARLTRRAGLTRSKLRLMELTRED